MIGVVDSASGALDPWGWVERAAVSDVLALPPQWQWAAALTERVELVDGVVWDGAEVSDLPGVAALLADGWRTLADPRAQLLPAVWPAGFRCWVPDRRPHLATQFDGVRSWGVPEALLPSTTRRAAEEAELVAEAGLPPRPSGRIYLVRSPFLWVGVKMLLRLIGRYAEQSSDVYPGPSEWTAAAAELLQWDQEQLRSWWTGADADAAHAWAADGRTGQDVDEFICSALTPDDRARLPDLDDEQVITWCHAVALAGGAAVDRIVLWRSVGLFSPPEHTLHYLQGLADEHIRTWFAAGLDPEWIRTGLNLTLQEIITWRDCGFTPHEVDVLRDNDEWITPAETSAFRAVGITDAQRMAWIRSGFDAATAAEFTRRGVRANEARVWRSRDLGPSDVTQGQTLPPGYVLRGWTLFAGQTMRDVEHSVTDPPGTRGRTAAQPHRPLRTSEKPGPTPAE